MKRMHPRARAAIQKFFERTMDKVLDNIESQDGVKDGMLIKCETTSENGSGLAVEMKVSIPFVESLADMVARGEFDA